MTKFSKKRVAEIFSAGNTDLVRYLALRLPNEDDARDLAQEAYLRLIRLEKTDLIRDPEAYLFRIAVNLVHEYWLKEGTKKTAHKDSLDPDTMAGPNESLDNIAGQKQSLTELERTLRVLPVLQQQAVLLHRRDGYTYDEISKQLGISRDMVKKYLSKGLARCRETLRRHRNG